MPLSVVDGALSATLNAQNYNGEVFAAQTNVHPKGWRPVIAAQPI
jgi:hypothetical protein